MRSANFTPAEATDMGRVPSSVSVRTTIPSPPLADYPLFAQQNGIEARRNSKEMPHGLVIVVVIERHAEDVRTHRMKLAQKSRKSRGTFMGRFRRHAVH